MKVNLTDKGLKILGLKPSRRIVNVPTERAFLLMADGCAVKDSGFMSLFAKNNPSVVKAKPKAKPKEKAVSKNAASREKAVNDKEVKK